MPRNGKFFLNGLPVANARADRSTTRPISSGLVDLLPAPALHFFKGRARVFVPGRWLYYPGVKVAHICHVTLPFRPEEECIMAILLPDARQLSDDVLEALRLRA